MVLVMVKTEGENKPRLAKVGDGIKIGRGENVWLGLDKSAKMTRGETVSDPFEVSGDATDSVRHFLDPLDSFIAGKYKYTEEWYI